MSIIPRLDGSDFWDISSKKWSSLLDDWRQPLIPRSFWMTFPEYFRNLHSSLRDSSAEVKYDSDKFQANFDVQHFKPEEITIKMKDNLIEIEGRHEETQNGHSQIYRHFVRKYTLPHEYDSNRMESKLSSDGVLTISAPKKITQASITERTIPIIRTGQIAKL